MNKKSTIAELKEREQNLMQFLYDNTDMPAREWSALVNELNNVRASIEQRKAKKPALTGYERKRYEVRSYSYLNI